MEILANIIGPVVLTDPGHDGWQIWKWKYELWERELLLYVLVKNFDCKRERDDTHGYDRTQFYTKKKKKKVKCL